MKKIIAKEINPRYQDFRFYFEDDYLTGADGDGSIIYIVRPHSRFAYGFNDKEYEEIQNQAQSVIDDFEYGILTDEALKDWAKPANHANINDTRSIAEYLTITTGKIWEVKSFTGYVQGDYCDVVYCVDHYSQEHIKEIGKLWLGCGTEFSIDDCAGYYVIDEVRWKEGDELRNCLADYYGCDPNDLEIHLYDGEHTVTDYKIMP